MQIFSPNTACCPGVLHHSIASMNAQHSAAPAARVEKRKKEKLCRTSRSIKNLRIVFQSLLEHHPNDPNDDKFIPVVIYSTGKKRKIEWQSDL